MAALRRNVGPFPLYAWLAGAGVFVVAFVFLMRGRGAPSQAKQPSGSIQPTVPVPYPIGGGDGGTSPFPDKRPVPPIGPGGSFPGSSPIPSGPPSSAPGVGAVPGSDFGWYHGDVGPSIPGQRLEWRWTNWFISAHRQDLPWLSSEPAQFSGYEFFQNVPGIGPAPPYSWEWRYAPIQTPTQTIAPNFAQTVNAA